MLLAAILPWTKTTLTPPHSLPWGLEEARRPVKGSPGSPNLTGPCVRTLVCGQARVPPASHCGAQPRVSLLPRKSLCHTRDWNQWSHPRPRDGPAHVVAPSTTAPTLTASP